MAKVYRVENDKGYGPYYTNVLSMGGFSVEGSDDHPPPTILMVLLKNNRFAFQSLTLLVRWFSKIEMNRTGPIFNHGMSIFEWLDKNGHFVAVYKVFSFVECPSRLQCAFDRDNATLVSTMTMMEAKSMLESEAV